MDILPCMQCGEHPRMSARAKYCSAKCRQRVKYLKHRDAYLSRSNAYAAARRPAPGPRECRQCGQDLAGQRLARVYCGDRCKSTAAWAKRKGKLTTEDHRRAYAAAQKSGAEARKNRKRWGPPRVYLLPECIRPDCSRKPIAKNLCSTHYGLERRRRADGGHYSNDAKARAAKYGGSYERFDARLVYERDGWICGICSATVDPQLKHPDPQSVSLDHVIPMAKGGDHSPANTQCSHLACNVGKHAGDRVPQADIEDVYALLLRGELTKPEAAKRVGVAVRTFNRRTQHLRDKITS